MKTGSKFFKKIMVMLLTMVLVGTMCPLVVSAAGKDYTTAKTVTFDKKVSGELTASNTLDWYKIVLPSAGELTINAQANIQYVRYMFYSGDSAETQLESKYFEWDEVSEYSNKTSKVRLAAGTYYFRVSVYTGSTAVTYGTYNFKASFTSANESIKEKINGINNTFKTASAISVNKQYTGQLSVNDDKDYYKFEITSDTEVVIKATYYMEYVNFYLYDADGTKLKDFWGYWDSSAQSRQVTITKTLSKGTYYFVATRYMGWSGLYDFKVIVNTSGWQQDSRGWWYQNSDGTYPKNTWQEIDSKWYYFDASGYIVTGWKQLGGKWYFFNTSGQMQTGWVSTGGKWYYFDKSGVMQTGWVSVSGKWYYLNSDGSMASREYIQGYWINGDGSWTYQYIASWRKDNTGWWYGDTSGWYAHNQSLKIDGKVYKFDAQGYCTNP